MTPEMITEIAEETGASERVVIECASTIDARGYIEDLQIFIGFVIDYVEYEVSQGRGQ